MNYTSIELLKESKTPQLSQDTLLKYRRVEPENVNFWQIPRWYCWYWYGAIFWKPLQQNISKLLLEKAVLNSTEDWSSFTQGLRRYSRKKTTLCLTLFYSSGSPDQQLHLLGNCWKCKFSAPNLPTYRIRNLGVEPSNVF